MRRAVFYSLMVMVAVGSCGVASLCFAKEVSVWSASERAVIESLSPVQGSLPADPSNRYLHEEKAVALGKQLFFDARLSGNQQLSCATCHIPERAFTDGRAVALGVAEGKRNTPTLVNMAFNRWYFWDGRADTLWSQAIGPIESPIEMAGKWPEIYQRLVADAEFLERYNQVFSQFALRADTPFAAVDLLRFQANLGKALAAFQWRLTQFNSRFDRYIQALREGQSTSGIMSAEELSGLRLFIGKGRCVSCHFGANLSDGEFHNIRLAAAVNSDDSGRFSAISLLQSQPLNALGLYSDASDKNDSKIAKIRYLRSTPELWAAYKTPTLRNVEQTAPYMHDGSKKTLADVIEHYSSFTGAAPEHHQNALLSPLNLSMAEKQQLQAFLLSLTGTIGPDLQ